jgi:hypothetical protein
MPMRIPAFVMEHPVESLIAGVLLLALLFGPNDRYRVDAAQAPSVSQIASAQKL